MNVKRIICLILAAVTVLTLIGSGIAILVSAESTTAPTESTTAAENKMELKNGDKIVIFILGAIVPAVIFLVMIVKTVWKKN